MRLAPAIETDFIGAGVLVGVRTFGIGQAVGTLAFGDALLCLFAEEGFVRRTLTLARRRDAFHAIGADLLGPGGAEAVSAGVSHGAEI